MKFGIAFTQLQAGQHLYRPGWKDDPDTGRMGWLYVTWDPDRGPLCVLRSAVRRGIGSTNIVPYLPRKDDMLAEDWEIRWPSLDR